MKRMNETGIHLLRGFAGLLIALLLTVAAVSHADAATVYGTGWHNPDVDPTVLPYETSITLKVELGQNFYLGDLFARYTNEGFYRGSELNATYTSGKTSVATVGSKNGYVKTIKKGTAVLTLKYGGKKYTCTLKVVSKGDLGTTGKYASLVKASDALADYYGVKITSKNSVTIMKKYIAVHNAQVALGLTDNYMVTSAAYCVSASGNTWKLINPSGPRIHRITSDLSSYGYDLLDSIKISSVKATAGKTTFQVTLKKTVTTEQLYYLQYMMGSDSEKWKTSPTAISFVGTSLTCWDTSGADTVLGAKCKAEKNSKTLTVTVYEDWKLAKKVKLKSKYKYELYLYIPSNNRTTKTFTVK
ncbi:MAG: hypothetical protein LUI07_10405 [Lachnospiraceae bacterium]|nr:hypothetical protein [Lachnospiraceae bacterium]